MSTKVKLTLAVAACIVAGPAAAQFQCPTGLRFVGQAYDQDSQINGEAKVPLRETLVKLPVGLKIDRNYRQSGGHWSGGSASATMSDGDVPNGFAVIAGGTEGEGKGWSVGKPDLVVLDEDGDTIIQRGVKIKLYCHTGSGEIDKVGRVGCSVYADICVLEKK